MRLNVQPTKFVNIDPESGKDLGSTYGIRVYDDEGLAYTNNYKNKDLLLKAVKKENLLDMLQEHFPDFVEGIERPNSAIQGIYVGEIYYNREDLGLDSK